MKSLRSHFWAVAGSVPWCCIIPALLSVLSMGTAVAARLWLARLTWLLLPLCLFLLGRAFWLIYIRKEGTRLSRWITWIAAVLVIGLWAPRLWWLV